MRLRREPEPDMDQASESPRFAVHMSPAPGAVIAPTGELDIASVPALRGNSAHVDSLQPFTPAIRRSTPCPATSCSDANPPPGHCSTRFARRWSYATPLM